MSRFNYLPPFAAAVALIMAYTGPATASSGCDDVPIAESAPAQYEQFLGRFPGQWEGGLDATVAVSEITPDGSAVVCYSWGEATLGGYHIDPGTMQDVSGSIDGNTLEFRSGGAVIKFTDAGDKTLDGHWQGRYNSSTGTFTRAE